MLSHQQGRQAGTLRALHRACLGSIVFLVILQLRLSPDQLEAKNALEAAVEEVKQELAGESEESKKDALTAELKEKESKLDTLMAEFEVTFHDLLTYHASVFMMKPDQPRQSPPTDFTA